MDGFWHRDIGNLMTIIAGVISLVVVFQKLRGDVVELGHRVSNGEEEMKQLTKMGVLTTISQHERRITNLELTLSDIAKLKTDIEWIKDNMRMRHTPPV
jgi:hypothetical protein